MEEVVSFSWCIVFFQVIKTDQIKKHVCRANTHLCGPQCQVESSAAGVHKNRSLARPAHLLERKEISIMAKVLKYTAMKQNG